MKLGRLECRNVKEGVIGKMDKDRVSGIKAL